MCFILKLIPGLSCFFGQGFFILVLIVGCWYRFLKLGAVLSQIEYSNIWRSLFNSQQFFQCMEQNSKIPVRKERFSSIFSIYTLKMFNLAIFDQKMETNASTSSNLSECLYRLRHLVSLSHFDLETIRISIR